MKVILLEDVKKLGKRDEIVDVSQGYATNFLFKENLAMEADKAGMKKLNKKKKAEAEQYEAEKEAALKLKAEIEAQEFKFKLKIGVSGNAFGSISHKQALGALRNKGYKLDKHQIHGEPIAHAGYDKFDLTLHKEVVAKMTVLVEEG